MQSTITETPLCVHVVRTYIRILQNPSSKSPHHEPALCGCSPGGFGSLVCSGPAGGSGLVTGLVFVVGFGSIVVSIFDMFSGFVVGCDSVVFVTIGSVGNPGTVGFGSIVGIAPVGISGSVGSPGSPVG